MHIIHVQDVRSIIVFRVSTQSAVVLDRDYGPSKGSGKFFLQPSPPEPRVPSRGLNSPPASSVLTPHSLEFSTKRRIFDRGPEVKAFTIISSLKSKMVPFSKLFILCLISHVSASKFLFIFILFSQRQCLIWNQILKMKIPYHQDQTLFQLNCTNGFVAILPNLS